MNKKGTFTDGIVILVVLLTIAMALIIVIPMFSTIKTSMDSSLGTRAQAVMAQNEYALGGADTFFLIMWFGLAIGSLVSAFFVRSHPGFAGLSMVFFLPMVLIGPIFANVWESISGQSEFSGALTTLSQTNFIMSNIHVFNLIFGALLLVVLYISFRSGD